MSRVDPDDVIRARYDYDPYGRSDGNLLADTGVPGKLPVDADFGFTGHYWDSFVALNLTYYRAYDPQLGRWLSRDPIEENGGLNLYGYVGNNPSSGIDLFGLRDIYVGIWDSRSPFVAGEGSVGHAIATELNGSTILSQFPTPHGPWGVNTFVPFQQALLKEGGDPDHVFRIHIPNDEAFNAAVFDSRTASLWLSLPITHSQTNCVSGVGKALRDGGVPVNRHLLPEELGRTLQQLSEKQNDPLYKILFNPAWSVTPVSRFTIPIARE